MTKKIGLVMIAAVLLLLTIGVGAVARSEANTVHLPLVMQQEQEPDPWTLIASETVVFDGKLLNIRKAYLLDPATYDGCHEYKVTAEFVPSGDFTWRDFSGWCTLIAEDGQNIRTPYTGHDEYCETVGWLCYPSRLAFSFSASAYAEEAPPVGVFYARAYGKE